MTWLGYLLSILASIFLILMVAFGQEALLFLIPLYTGIITYWLFRPTWNDRIPAVKKISIMGAILTVILIIERMVIQKLVSQIQLSDPSLDLVPFIAAPSIPFIIGLCAVFVAVPALLAFLDGLTQPGKEGLTRNPFLVLAYVILTLGIYQIYWLWLIKKGLRNSNIQTTSLWWLLLPIAGPIILHVNFSKALEQKTQRKFLTWFLIFFFFEGLSAVINQAIINHDLSKQKAL